MHVKVGANVLTTAKRSKGRKTTDTTGIQTTETTKESINWKYLNFAEFHRSKELPNDPQTAWALDTSHCAGGPWLHPTLFIMLR